MRIHGGLSKHGWTFHGYCPVPCQCVTVVGEHAPPLPSCKVMMASYRICRYRSWWQSAILCAQRAEKSTCTSCCPNVLLLQTASISFMALCQKCTREGSLCATKQIPASGRRSSTCGPGYPSNSTNGSLVPTTLMHRQVHSSSDYGCSTFGLSKADRVVFRQVTFL